MTPTYPTANYNGVTVSVVPDDQIAAFTALWRQSIGIAIDGIPEDMIGDLLTDTDGPLAGRHIREIYVMSSRTPDMMTVCPILAGTLGGFDVEPPKEIAP